MDQNNEYWNLSGKVMDKIIREVEEKDNNAPDAKTLLKRCYPNHSDEEIFKLWCVAGMLQDFFSEDTQDEEE